ncbi:hypothetical protein X767_29130 [Mesorhizobium sp. LSJC264A00]|nr:hypothetical protein X767_29130 [Mesorhizobium sp. LSJC264A00]
MTTIRYCTSPLPSTPAMRCATRKSSERDDTLANLAARSVLPHIHLASKHELKTRIIADIDGLNLVHT